jgi:glycosyltransferase involved in cell wall biosynthesis
LTSKHIASFVVDTFDVAPQKISIFPNLIDTELFNLKEKNDIYNNRIVFVGRLNIQKNLFSLIEASKKAGVGLDLVGFGELKTELQNFSKHINADVRHLGTCSNSQLPFLLASYPIFILPSFYEGNPKALLEAMSCGKAVIGTDVAGIREIIKDGENGILCDIHSDSIASAICRLVNDSHLRKRLGDNARRYIIENCYVNKIRDAEMNIYRNITKEKI